MLDTIRTYAKTPYIAHDNFDELHALSRALAELCRTQSPNYFYSKTNRTYAKTPYIAHDNFDELHYSHVRSPNYFYSKTFSFSSQITFILIEGCFNWSVRYFDQLPRLFLINTFAYIASKSF